MRFSDRLKMFEGQYMFAKWVGGNEYVKLVHVGEDFFEFNIINADTMEYQETTMIQKDMLLEVIFGGADVQRVLAEMSCNLPSAKKD
jgi:hypothetical protein